MANDGKTLEKLYLELGLDISRLQADILAADRTVTENLGRINRAQNTIKLRVEADTAALDRVKDAVQIFEIQERGLNQQLSLSRDKLAILEAAYRQVANNSNSTALAVQRAEQAFQKQRIEVARLEAQLKSLSAQKISFDTSQLQEKISQINSRIQHVRIQADIDVSKLQGANAAFDAQKIHIAAVTREIELQRQKLIQLQETMYRSARNTGGDSVQTLNIKSNVLQQIQEITRLETRLKELQGRNINLQIRADSIRQAEQTINESIARINAKVEHIRVKTDIDVSKLGAAASEFDKAKAHVQGLNRELDLQNQKLAELKKALGASVSANGLNNVKTINLQTEIQKQIQAIDQLKAKINELNKIEPPKSNLLSNYLNIKGDVAGKLNQLTSSFYGITQASQSADGAITKTLEIISAIPHPAGKAAAALAAIPLVIKGIYSSLLDLANPAIGKGDAFYVMSRGMQLSVADMGKLSTIAKVTGIDINEVNSSLRRFSMQMTKAGEKNNLAAQTMKRYGAEIFDANGRIKNAIELSAELGKALKAAEAEGNGAAFRDLVGGKFWSGDFITYLEDFADNVEQAKKVIKNGLSNPTWAHAIQGEINTLNAQTAQLSGAFSAALMPVIAEIVPKMTEQFGELTRVIAANKENIKLLGDAFALPVRILNEFTGGVIKLSTAIDELKSKETTLGKVFAQYGEYRDDLAALMNVAPTTALTAIFSPMKGSTDLAIKAYREEIEEFKKAQAEAEAAAKAKNDAKQAEMANAFGLSGLTVEQAQKLEGAETRLNEERIKRAQETADIIYKLNHTSYENQLRDLEKFEAEEINKIRETEELIKTVTGQDKILDEERFAIFENIAAKREQIEEEKERKLDEIRRRIAAADQTEFEKRMTAIENEKDAWIQAGMTRAEAQQLAEKQKTDYIRNVEKELSDSITSLHQTDLERQLARIEQEKKAWIEKCNEEVKATQWAEQAKADAQRNAAMATLRQQAEEYEIFQKGGYAGLRAHKAAQLEAQGVNPDYLYMTTEQLNAFQKANQVAEKSLLPNFMTQYDKAEHAQQMQQWREWKNQQNESLDKQNYIIVDGVKKGLSEVLNGTNFEYGRSNTEESHSVNISPEGDRYTFRDDKYSYDKNGQLSQQDTNIKYGDLPTITEPENYSEILQSVQGVSESFVEFTPAVQSVVESFNELNTVVAGVSENLSLLTAPEYATQESPFSVIEPQIQSLFQTFQVLGEGVGAVTVKISELSTALENLSIKQANSSPASSQPVEVTNNISIEEAHAWDYDHIQDLADRVADIIEPRIVSAIGGNSNAY